MHPTDFTIRGALGAMSDGIVTAEALTAAHL